MMVWLLGSVVVVALALAGMVWRFRAQVAKIEGRVLTTGSAPSDAHSVPPEVQVLAARAMVDAARAPRGVCLHQEAELRMTPDGPWSAITARQVISARRPAFSWLATRAIAGVPLFRVLDAYVGGQGLLLVRLLGGIPMVNAAGPDLDRGEAMRYLAELAWDPDAFLHNPDILWKLCPDGWIDAALQMPDGPAQVSFRLTEEGDIAEMLATGRPARLPDGTVELRDWRGLFHDYGEMGGRRIPLRGEVGYVTDGHYAPYWRGTITSYQIVQ